MSNLAGKGGTHTEPRLMKVRWILPVIVLSLLAVPASRAGAGWPDWTGVPGDIAGRGAVSDGEAIWNDYLYDDSGANVDGFHGGSPDYVFPLTGIHVNPADPTSPTVAPSAHNGRFRRSGDYSYPPVNVFEDPHSYINVADIAEVRVTATAGDVFIRTSFTAMAWIDPTVLGIAIDADGDPTGGGAWPYHARLSTRGWDSFVTVWHDAAMLTDAGGTTALESRTTLGDESVLEVRIPRALVGGGTWRLIMGAGRGAPQGWAEPSITTTQQASPGALSLAPRLYDLAFNQDEPNSVWNDAAQSDALAAGDVDAHGWTVDLDALAAGADVPPACTSGVAVHPHVAPLVLGVGLLGHEHSGNVNYDYQSPLQPHTVVSPSSVCDEQEPAPGIDLWLHPGNANHNTWVVATQWSDDRGRLFVRDAPATYARPIALAESANRIVAESLSRGEGWDYGDRPGEELDDWQVLDETKMRYRHDPERVRLIGMSRGGQGVTLLGAHRPHEFSHLVMFSGVYDHPRLANLANLPSISIHGDSFLDATYLEDLNAASDRLLALDYEHIEMTWEGRGHDVNLVEESWDLVEALTAEPRAIDPSRVVFRVDPADDVPMLPRPVGTAWVDDIMVPGEAAGTVEVTSLAHPADLPERIVSFAGVFSNATTGNRISLRGKSHDPEATVRARMPDMVDPAWVVESFEVSSTALGWEQANTLIGTFSGVSSATLDLAGARIDPDAPINLIILSDMPADVTLVHGARATTIELMQGTTNVSVTLP